MGGHTNVRLCASNAIDKKPQNISEIEQKSKIDEKSAPRVASASRYGRVGAARLRGIGLAARFVVIP